MNLDRAGIQLPIDVLLYIIEFVDHPKDLLAFALTARALCTVIIPRHIDYRRISCILMSSDHVWKHLLDTPNICSRIRYLSTQFGEQPEIPRVCKTDSNTTPLPHDRDHTLFSQALSKMVNLKVIKHAKGLENRSIWVMFEAIGKAGCELEEMKVCAREAPRWMPNQHLEGDSEFLKKREMFSLFYNRLPSLRKYTVRNGPSYDGLQTLIAPNLTHMNVTYWNQPVFISGYWPNLQHLVSRTTRNNTQSEIHSLREFFLRHHKLITLSTDGILRWGWAVESDDFLPKLKSFGMTVYYTSDYDNTTITSPIAVRLTHLHVTPQMHLYLKKHGTILSKLETCLYVNADPRIAVQDLVDLIPNIKKLSVRLEHERDSYSCTTDEIMERIPLFTDFKYLRVLLGPFDDTRISVNGYPLCKLLYDFPNILYIRARLRLGGPSEFLRLERDGIAKVMRYECEKTCPNECDEDSWGGFFEE